MELDLEKLVDDTFLSIRSYKSFARLVKNLYLRSQKEDLLDVLEVVLDLKRDCFFDMWELSRVLYTIDDIQLEILKDELLKLGFNDLVIVIDITYDNLVSQDKLYETTFENFSHYLE